MMQNRKGSDETTPLIQQSSNNNYNDNNDDIVVVSNENNIEDAHSTATEASGTSSNRRHGKCFSICPFELPAVTPPKIWLRNKIIPKDMWHEFPNGTILKKAKFVCSNSC